MAKSKKFKQVHSANAKFGMGDYYGTGRRNPIGKIRSDSVSMANLSKKKMKSPPKSLA